MSSRTRDSSRLQSTSARWRAITQRDAAAHYSFFYGVKTTRIYCRPTCTARLARRANVVYFDTREQAQYSGFRPCARCKPDDDAFVGQREEIVTRTLGLLRDGQGSARIEGGVKSLAKDVGVTPSYLCRVFKKTMGCTLGEYCRHFEALPLSGVKDATATSSSTGPKIEPPLRATHPIPTSSTSSSSTPTHSSSSPNMVDPWPGIGESLDIDIDFAFDEWVWNEGFDFNDWILPDMSTSHSNHTYHQQGF